MPKVSIVIPVYNTETYIGEAIESIRRQTLREFEIIVVDDGSTDRSLSVIQSLSAEDPRIQVHTQANSGVSAARNKGLQYVTGEFLYFLDSDDLLEADALETCYRKCTEEKLDFTFFDAESINPGNRYTAQNYLHTSFSTEETAKGIDILNRQLDTATYRSPVWLNFIRTSYLQQHRLSFYPGIIHEDELFCFLLYVYAERVGYIPRTFSQRRLREDSIMTQKFSWKNIAGYLTVTEEISKFRQGKPTEMTAIADKYLRSMLNAVVWKSHTLPFRDKYRLFRECVRRKYLPFLRPKNLFVMFFKS